MLEFTPAADRVPEAPPRRGPRATAFRLWIRDKLFAPYKRSISRQEIGRYLKEARRPRLNLGAGGNRLEGWLNTDLHPPPGVVYMNACAPWPVPDDTFEGVLCEHMIEHIPKRKGLGLLREAFRTARPGAKLRVVTPDLDFFARAVLEGAPDEESYLRFVGGFNKTPCETWTDAINLIFYEHGHCYIYSRAELRSAIEASGFEITAETRGGFCDDPVFDGADGHAAIAGHGPNAIEAFALEARKPG